MIKMDKIRCVGCSACVAICPTKALQLKTDEKGFYYPAVQKSLCVDCNLCEKVCMLSSTNRFSESRLECPQYYIAILKNEEELQYCQSGGVGYGLGKAILNDSGVVYGCVYEKCVATHVRITSKEGLKKACGSKYVQSRIGDTYENVYKDLLGGKRVLFTGTSCYVEGLYLFLAKKKCSIENLYTADMICHGVPSPLILRDFLDYKEEKHGSAVLSINMRNRKYAPAVCATIQYADGQMRKDELWSELFYSRLALRDSCENCMFTTRDKPADITMSDITGIADKYKRQINTGNPVSMVIVHSKKGKSLIERAELKLTAINENEFDQPQLNYPTKRNVQKEAFWKQYRKKGFKYVLNKYTSAGGIKAKIRRKVLMKLKRW